MPDSKILERLVRQVMREVRCGAPSSGRFAASSSGRSPRPSRCCFASRWARWPSWSRARSCVAGRRARRALVGYLRPVTPAEAARLADRGFGFQDRVATALEWARASRPHAAGRRRCVADTVARVEARDGRRVVPRLLPREAKLVPMPLALGLVLALAPPIPLPTGGLPNFTAKSEDDEAKPADRGGQARVRRAEARRPSASALPAGRHAGAHARAPPGRRRSHPGRRSRRRVQGHLAGRQEPRLQRLSQEGRRADPDARAGGPACPTSSATSPRARARRCSSGPRSCAGPWAATSSRPRRCASCSTRWRSSAARAAAQNPWSGDDRRGHGSPRGRAERQGHGRHGARAQQAPLHGGQGRRRQGAPRRPRERAARRPAGESARAGPAGARGRGRLPRGRGALSRARARAATPRAIPPSACAPTLRRGRRGAVAAGPQGRHGHQPARHAAPTPRRGCSTSAWWGSTAR